MRACTVVHPGDLVECARPAGHTDRHRDVHGNTWLYDSDPDRESFEAFMIDDEIDDRPACLSCIDRPKHLLGRFRHRLWICSCGQAWRTRRGRYEKATWAWKRWPR